MHDYVLVTIVKSLTYLAKDYMYLVTFWVNGSVLTCMTMYLLKL
jgi:hypothetical protein